MFLWLLGIQIGWFVNLKNPVLTGMKIPIQNAFSYYNCWVNFRPTSYLCRAQRNLPWYLWLLPLIFLVIALKPLVITSMPLVITLCHCPWSLAGFPRPLPRPWSLPVCLVIATMPLVIALVPLVNALMSMAITLMPVVYGLISPWSVTVTCIFFFDLALSSMKHQDWIKLPSMDDCKRGMDCKNATQLHWTRVICIHLFSS